MKFAERQPDGLSTFRDTCMRLMPRWLRGPIASRILYSIGLGLDSLVDAIALGAKLQFPLQCKTLCPTALDKIGQERDIPRGLSEPDAGYAERLVRSIDDKRISGSPFALMSQIQGYLAEYPTMVRVYTNEGYCFTVEADGTKVITPPWDDRPWEWDTSADFSRFFVVIYAPRVGGSLTLWDTLGTYSTWSSGVTFADLTDTCGFKAIPEGLDAQDMCEALKLIVSRWTPAHAWCEWITIAFDADSLNPTTSYILGWLPAYWPRQNWGNWHKTDFLGNDVLARLLTARYIYLDDPPT